MTEEIEELPEVFNDTDSYIDIPKPPKGSKRWKNTSGIGEPVIHAETGTVVGYVVSGAKEVLDSNEVDDILEEL